MARVYLSLGSNVVPENNLRLGVRELARRYSCLTLSPVYRNKAVGFAGDDFLNMVVACDVDDGLDRLAADIEAIHSLAGRRRGKERFSARSLDIDILMVDQQVLEGPPLTLPREDVLRYAFVLKPLVDIAPDLVHPGTGRRMADHWEAMQADGGASGDAELHRVSMTFDMPLRP